MSDEPTIPVELTRKQLKVLHGLSFANWHEARDRIRRMLRSRDVGKELIGHCDKMEWGKLMRIFEDAERRMKEQEEAEDDDV